MKHDTAGTTPRSCFLILILQDTLLVLTHCQRLISLVAQFAQHCFQHRELKVKWRLAVASQAELLRRKVGLLPAFCAWLQPCEYSKYLRLTEIKCIERRTLLDIKRHWKVFLSGVKTALKLREAERIFICRLSQFEHYAAKTSDPLRLRTMMMPTKVASEVNQARPLDAMKAIEPNKKSKVGSSIAFFLQCRLKGYSLLAWKAHGRRMRILDSHLRRKSHSKHR